MATLALTPVPFGFIPGAAGVDVTPADLTAYPSADTGVTFPNSGGNVLLAVNNGYSASITVTGVAARGVQGQIPALPPYSLPAGKYQMFGPFPVSDFGNTVTVSIAAAGSGVTVGAFEMTGS